jgi:peptidoglycan/LPS O-acetylase OafA/YrhL
MWMRLIVEKLPPPFVRAGELLTPVVLVVFSIAVFRYWEEPARKGLRNWFTKQRQLSVRLIFARPAHPDSGRI